MKRFDLACLRDVHGQRIRLSTCGGDCAANLFGSAVVKIGHDNRDPSRRHSVRYRAADSTSPSGD